VNGGGCVECTRLLCSIWRKANRDKRKEYNAKWVRLHPEKERAHRFKYRKENKEKESRRTRAWLAANRERKRALDAAWPKNNPLANVSRVRRRRARQIEAPGRGVSATEWQEVLEAAVGLCSYCNESRPLTLDHVEPLALGGAHDAENVVAACKPCNSSKGDTHVLVWMASRIA
jgi:5-methylcytosine-specific restriction endonuclease McrA